jgi:hypothetical protein
VGIGLGDFSGRHMKKLALTCSEVQVPLRWCQLAVPGGSKRKIICFPSRSSGPLNDARRLFGGLTSCSGPTPSWP